MTIKISDIITNIFIILKENNLPMIIELSQVYKIIGSMNSSNKYRIDFSGASILELKLSNSFNFISDTKEITLASGVDIDTIKKKSRKDIKEEMCKQNITKVFGINDIYDTGIKRRLVK